MSKYVYRYPRPAVTVDLVIIQNKQILLIKRKNEPFQNHWALPGGFVDENEDLHKAAQRELKEETNLDIPYLDQIGAFGKPFRDPRGHTITVAYYAEINPELSIKPKAGDDAAEVEWFSLRDITSQRVPLAFDHLEIIEKALALFL